MIHGNEWENPWDEGVLLLVYEPEQWTREPWSSWRKITKTRRISSGLLQNKDTCKACTWKVEVNVVHSPLKTDWPQGTYNKIPCISPWLITDKDITRCLPWDPLGQSSNRDLQHTFGRVSTWSACTLGHAQLSNQRHCLTVHMPVCEQTEYIWSPSKQYSNMQTYWLQSAIT